jgi:hypothetical protein
MFCVAVLSANVFKIVNVARNANAFKCNSKKLYMSLLQVCFTCVYHASFHFSTVGFTDFVNKALGKAQTDWKASNLMRCRVKGVRSRFLRYQLLSQVPKGL